MNKQYLGIFLMVTMGAVIGVTFSHFRTPQTTVEQNLTNTQSDTGSTSSVNSELVPHDQKLGDLETEIDSLKLRIESLEAALAEAPEVEGTEITGALAQATNQNNNQPT